MHNLNSALDRYTSSHMPSNVKRLQPDCFKVSVHVCVSEHLIFESYQHCRLLQSDGTAPPSLYKHPEYDCIGHRLKCINRPTLSYVHTHTHTQTNPQTETRCVIKAIITQCKGQNWTSGKNTLAHVFICTWMT